MINEKDRPEVERLVKSLVNKVGFTAPEILEEKVRLYIETAWLRGRSAGIEETRELLCTDTSGTGEVKPWARISTRATRRQTGATARAPRPGRSGTRTRFDAPPVTPTRAVWRRPEKTSSTKNWCSSESNMPRP